MTDLEKYKELFKATSMAFKEYKYKVKELDGFEEKDGVVENTGEIVKLKVDVYKELDYTALEPESIADGSGSFNFDENGKLNSFTATGDY